jgi:hypothetical protein
MCFPFFTDGSLCFECPGVTPGNLCLDKSCRNGTTHFVESLLLVDTLAAAADSSGGCLNVVES